MTLRKDYRNIEKMLPNWKYAFKKMRAIIAILTMVQIPVYLSLSLQRTLKLQGKSESN